MLLGQFLRRREELQKLSSDGTLKEIEVNLDEIHEQAEGQNKFSPEGSRFRDDFFLPDDFDLSNPASALQSETSDNNFDL